MFEYKGVKFFYLEHDCFRITDDKTIYTDPFRIPSQEEKADVVTVGHEHFDHLSLEDIKKVVKEDTVIIASINCKGKIKGLKVEEVKYLKPGEEATVKGVEIRAVPAYNVNKFRAPGQVFHPKEYNGVGFILKIGNIKIYHAGDTDLISEMSNLGEIDVALLPVSGTYVMTPDEAVEAVKRIKPKVAIPMHYGAIVGEKTDAETFRSKASNICEVVILEKEK